MWTQPRLKDRERLFTNKKGVRHGSKDVYNVGTLEARDSPADRCAVTAFHLQVAALSLKTVTNLTCHLSACSALSVHSHAQNDQRGFLGVRIQARSNSN